MATTWQTSCSETGAIGVDAFGGNTNGQDNGGTGVAGIGGDGKTGDGDGAIFQGGTGSVNGDGIGAGAGSSGIAGNFTGNVDITGTLNAGTKHFKIDHPLDPANKYLVHASVESSEMMNIYTGNVTTDAQGEARVQLPDWFEALNTDFRYQLTVIGQFAQAIVSSEVQNHEFAIRSSVPSVKVSWQITGVRQDAFAKANPLVVEEESGPIVVGVYSNAGLRRQAVGLNLARASVGILSVTLFRVCFGPMEKTLKCSRNFCATLISARR